MLMQDRRRGLVKVRQKSARGDRWALATATVLCLLCWVLLLGVPRPDAPLVSGSTAGGPGLSPHSGPGPVPLAGLGSVVVSVWRNRVREGMAYHNHSNFSFNSIPLFEGRRICKTMDEWRVLGLWVEG